MPVERDIYGNLLSARARAAEIRREAQTEWLRAAKVDIATVAEELMVTSTSWPHDDEGMVRREVRGMLTDMFNRLMINMPEGRILL